MSEKLILYVDDDPDILAIVSLILEESGYEVMGFDIPPSIARISELNADLILLDEWIRNERGSGLCRQVKEMSGNGNVPVVLISAVNGLEEIAQTCGADFFIKKPFDIDYLLQIVKVMITKDL